MKRLKSQFLSINPLYSTMLITSNSTARPSGISNKKEKDIKPAQIKSVNNTKQEQVNNISNLHNDIMLRQRSYQIN
ncbi:MAG: hypothetical protein WAM14_01460 [Candidatus Nitrosopolaris sp.]